MKKFIFIFAIILFSVVARSSSPSNHSDTSKKESTSITDSIIKYGKTFLGKPYRYQGASRWPMDCSGFVAHIFSKYDIALPHSAAGIAKDVLKVDFSEIKKGDFLFFKGRNIQSSVTGHVCIVVDVNNETLSMMHSCSSGIVIEQYPNSDYYNKRFLFAGRLPFLNLTSEEEDNNSDHSSTKSIKDNITIIGVSDMMLGSK